MFRGVSTSRLSAGADKSKNGRILPLASWFLFSSILSIYNSWLFSDDHVGFPVPLFVLTVQFFVQFGLAAVVRRFWPEQFRPPQEPLLVDYMKIALPAAIAAGVAAALSNMSLQEITSSFSTMCKSSSLLFVLLFALLFRLEPFSLRRTSLISLISIGTFLAAASKTHFVLHAFFFLITASFLGAFCVAATELLLKNPRMGIDDPVAVVYFLSPVAGLTLAVISFVVDDWVGLVRSSFFDEGLKALRTSIFLMLPGVFAFCASVSENYIIKRTGIVPMSVAWIAKEVATIAFSAAVLGEHLSPLNVLGVAISVCGIVLFVYFRSSPRLDALAARDFELDETIHLARYSGSEGDPSSPRHAFPSEARQGRTLFSAGLDEGE